MIISYIWKLIWWIKTQTIYRLLYIRHINLHSYLGPVLFIFGGRGINISSKVRIFPGCRMECHDNGTISIENDVSIGQNFHVTSGGGLCLRIGAHTTISGNTFVTNIDHNYREIGLHIMKQAHICKETVVGENCFIGYGVAIQAGTRLGKQCVVGANSVVRGNFPDYSVIVGAPAKVIKRYNFDTGKWERTNPDGSFIEK